MLLSATTGDSNEWGRQEEAGQLSLQASPVSKVVRCHAKAMRAFVRSTCRPLHTHNQCAPAAAPPCAGPPGVTSSALCSVARASAERGVASSDMAVPPLPHGVACDGVAPTGSASPCPRKRPTLAAGVAPSMPAFAAVTGGVSAGNPAGQGPLPPQRKRSIGVRPADEGGGAAPAPSGR